MECVVYLALSKDVEGIRHREYQQHSPGPCRAEENSCEPEHSVHDYPILVELTSWDGYNPPGDEEDSDNELLYPGRISRRSDHLETPPSLKTGTVGSGGRCSIGVSLCLKDSAAHTAITHKSTLRTTPSHAGKRGSNGIQ